MQPEPEPEPVQAPRLRPQARAPAALAPGQRGRAPARREPRPPALPQALRRPPRPRSARRPTPAAGPWCRSAPRAGAGGRGCCARAGRGARWPHERSRARGQFFLEHLQARLATRIRTGIAARDGHLVARIGRRGRFLHARHDPSAALLRRRRRGCGRATGDRGREAAPVGVEVGSLGTDLAPRLAGIDGAHRVGRRNVEDRTGAQAVDVAAIEGLGVRAQQRDQHLVEGGAGVGVRARDAVHGVATPHRPCVDGRTFGRQRTRGRGHGGARHRTRGPCRRSLDRRGERARRGKLHRVEQEGVFTHQVATRPVELDQQVDEGVVDRAVAAEAHHRARGPRIHADTDRAHRGAIAQVRAPERIRRSDAGAQRLQLLRVGRDLDLGTQGLAQAAQDVDLAKAGRLHRQRQRGDGEGEQGSPDRCCHFGSQNSFPRNGASRSISPHLA